MPEQKTPAAPPPPPEQSAMEAQGDPENPYGRIHSKQRNRNRLRIDLKDTSPIAKLKS